MYDILFFKKKKMTALMWTDRKPVVQRRKNAIVLRSTTANT